MSDFWKSGSGQLLTGNAEDAFLREFSLIPNNSCAIAKIATFANVIKDNKFTGQVDKFINITWRILEGEFKNQEVTQKIKPFSGTNEAVDRALNMLKLIMTLCNFSPSHSSAPTDDDLKKMVGKTCGIKIREFAMPKNDGSGLFEGNFVSEVHDAVGFKSETGIKMQITHRAPDHLDSAYRRNPPKSDTIEDEIPF